MDAEKIKSLTEKVRTWEEEIANIHSFFYEGLEGGGCPYPMKEDPIKFYQDYIGQAKTSYLNALKEISSSKDLILLFKKEVGGMKKGLVEIETYAGRLLVNATETEKARETNVEIDKLESILDKVMIPLIVKEVYGGKRVKAKKYVSRSELKAQIEKIRST